MTTSRLHIKPLQLLPSKGESVSPTLDVSHHLLKQAISGSEVSYDNTASFNLSMINPITNNKTLLNPE